MVWGLNWSGYGTMTGSRRRPGSYLTVMNPAGVGIFIFRAGPFGKTVIAASVIAARGTNTLGRVSVRCQLTLWGRSPRRAASATSGAP